MDLKTIQDFLKSLDPHGLQICEKMIVNLMSDHFSKSSPNVNDFVEYHEKFVGSTDENVILSEIESLGFNHKTSKAEVQNKFLSSFAEPYIWDSSKKGPVINKPISIGQFPGINRLMGEINEQFGFNMNSALVTFYKNGCVNARLHDDAETELDPNQPICVVSFGVKRQVQFVYKGNKTMAVQIWN